MPTYSYRCRECGEIAERVRRIAERRDPLGCDACGSDTEFIISRIAAVYPPYPELGRGEVWKNTNLEGMDGRNPVTYRSENAFVDLGK